MDAQILQGTNPVNVQGSTSVSNPYPGLTDSWDDPIMDEYDSVDDYIKYLEMQGQKGLDWQLHSRDGSPVGTLRDIIRASFEKRKSSDPYSYYYNNDMNTDDINTWKKYYESLYDKYNYLQNEYWKQEQDFNSREADKARAWSEYMESTRVDRNIEQLKRNGINPLLAVDFLLGGSNYSSSAASGSSPASTFMNPSSMLSAEIEKIGQNKQLVAQLIRAIAGIFKIFAGNMSSSGVLKILK